MFLLITNQPTCIFGHAKLANKSLISLRLQIQRNNKVEIRSVSLLTELMPLPRLKNVRIWSSLEIPIPTLNVKIANLYMKKHQLKRMEQRNKIGNVKRRS